jgi:uncharacterized OB-fold protein
MVQPGRARPYKEGLWRAGADGRPVLVGSRCSVCERIHFPRKPICPDCGCRDVDEVELSRHGRIYSFTTVYQGPTGFRTPYTVGYVDLPEGLRVFTQLVATKPLALGQSVVLDIGPVRWESAEAAVIGIRFRSAEEVEVAS